MLSETLINVKTQFARAKTDLFTQPRQFPSALCSSGYSSPWHLVTYLADGCAHTRTARDSTRGAEPAGAARGFVAVLITLLTTFNHFLGAFRPPRRSNVQFAKASSENGEEGERHTVVWILHFRFCAQCPEHQHGLREVGITFRTKKRLFAGSFCCNGGNQLPKQRFHTRKLQIFFTLFVLCIASRRGNLHIVQNTKPATQNLQVHYVPLHLFGAQQI